MDGVKKEDSLRMKDVRRNSLRMKKVGRNSEDEGSENTHYDC